MRDLNYMWKRLEGTKEEKAYLDKRFNEMSVKEQYVLEGAIQIIGIYTAADMINLTEQLSSFDFYYKLPMKNPLENMWLNIRKMHLMRYFHL